MRPRNACAGKTRGGTVLGKLLKAPEVRYGRITGALERKHAGKQIVVVEHIATVDSMDKGPCGLSADL